MPALWPGLGLTLDSAPPYYKVHMAHFKLRQAGTWDPLPEYLHLHLDKCFLELQNTKILQGTKNTCMRGQSGQL